MYFNQIYIISTGYNCELFVEKYAQSVLNQNYPKDKFKIIVWNDCSTDQTGERVDNCFKLVQNAKVFHAKERFFAPKAQRVLMTNPEIDDESIIMVVDLDDELPDNEVLSRVNSYYNQNQNLLFTFGDFVVRDNGIITPSSQNRMPEDFKKLRVNKGLNLTCSHLKTWKSKLYKKIREDAFLNDDGQFMKSSTEPMYTYPMLEMAGKDRVLFTKDINYIYNLHDNNCIKQHNWMSVCSPIVGRKKPYHRIDDF